eukprot:129442_1
MAEAAAPVIIKKLWDHVFSEEMKVKPKLLLRFNDGRRPRQRLIKWNKDKIDPSMGPFAYVFSIADGLAQDKDISRCEMIYYEDTEPLSIYDDDSLLEVLEAGADMKGNKRLIEIQCYDDPHVEEPKLHPRYRKAYNSYNYAVGLNLEPSAEAKSEAERSLQEANLGSYSLEAEGVAIIDADADEFLTKALNIATEFEWDGKTQSIIKTVPSSRRVQQARSYVNFDASSWTITGSYAKFAGWKSDEENNKSSMFVATSKFEFTVPRSEREGNLGDKYLWLNGGGITQKYMTYIKTVLESEAIIESKKKIAEPDPAEWAYKYEL